MVPVEDDDTVETLTERIKGVERPQLVEYVGRMVRHGFTVEGRRCVLGPMEPPGSEALDRRPSL